MNERYALVLGGGGARGAYQIGVWKAFRELRIKFDCIVGVSVGALNGVLMAENLYQKAIELWNNINLEKIVYIPESFLSELKNGQLQFFSTKFFKAILNIWEEIKKHRGLDSSPLYNIILQYTDERKLRKSKLDFGLVTFRVDDFKPQVLFLEDIPEKKLPDYLLASASLPGFKPAKIEDKSFIDGGVYNNIPYNVIKNRGYRRIIVVDISGPGLKETPKIENTETIYIKNSVDFGSLLDFRPAVIKDLILLGYLDTLRIFQRLDGIFYFYRIDKNILKKMESDFHSPENRNKIASTLRIDLNKRGFEESIRRILPENVKYYKYLSIALVEQCARFLNIPIIKLYKFRDFLSLVKNEMNLKYQNEPEIFNYKPKNIIEEFINNDQIQKSLILKVCFEFLKKI